MQEELQYRSLAHYFKSTGATQRSLVTRTGISEPMLCNLLQLKRACSVHWAIALSDASGVPVQKLVDWRKIPAKRKRPKVSRNGTGFTARKA